MEQQIENVTRRYGFVTYIQHSLSIQWLLSERHKHGKRCVLYAFEARSYTSHDLIILFVAFFKISNLEDF